MNKPTNNHHDQTRDAQQGISKNTEESEVQPKPKQNENKFQVAYLSKSKGLISKIPAKVLGGLAVGALMLTATGLAMGREFTEVGLPTASDSIQVPVEVQWDLEDMFNHSSVGLPTASDSIQVIPDDEWMFNSPYQQDFS